MSWNKNTINNSKIDSYIKIFEDYNIKYKVIELGKIKGFGLNDSRNTEYLIRMLVTEHHIHIDRFDREIDCDLNDTIETITYNIDEAPRYWYLERILDFGKVIKEKRKIDLTKFDLKQFVS